MTNNKVSDFNNLALNKILKGKNQASKKEKAESTNEFEQLLDAKKSEEQQKAKPKEEQDVFISAHATKRLRERNLEVDGEEYLKLKEAISRLKNKGGKDSLVITNNAAYIVDVGNNTIVTAIDKSNMSENIFTKIDSTLVMD